MLQTPQLELAPFLRVAARDLTSDLPGTSSASTHLSSAIQWLIRAHDAQQDGGVSYGYSLLGGWRPSYIETTGYIAVTFFRLSQLHCEPNYEKRATQMVDFLLRSQNQDGSFSNPRYSHSSGIVFDTGQDLFGLVRAYRESGEKHYLDAGVRSANWLTRKAADSTGLWTRYTHKNAPHVYNTRTAWALLQLDQEAPSKERRDVAQANLDWAVSQQKSPIYDQCAFEPEIPPFTHTIAYAIRGLFESGELLNSETYRQSAIRAARCVAAQVRANGQLPGQLTVEGNSAARYCCLTGNAQMAIVWAKMFHQVGDESLRDAAVRCTRYVMRCQDLATSDPNRRGAIKGSHPVWGRYSRLTYPNWSTKFFVDALLECEAWL